MKKYVIPMLNVVSINKKDIIVTSIPAEIKGSQANEAALSGDRFRDWEEYGY